jgi:hypothetical protein
MTKKDADGQLDYQRVLRNRLLGDRVLQHHAWRIADQLGWPETLDAEYVALTQLQADAFITFDENLAHAVTGLAAIAPIEALSRSTPLPQRGRAPQATAASHAALLISSRIM